MDRSVGVAGGSVSAVVKKISNAVGSPLAMLQAGQQGTVKLFDR